jgi:hypothetical protein
MHSDNYSLSCNRKPTNFALHLPVFNIHTTNISRIANLISGGEWAYKTGQSGNSSCCNRIRTQILHCCHSCRNCTIETAVWFQCGQQPAGIYPVWVTSCVKLPSFISLWFLPRTRACILGLSQTAARNRGSVANTSNRTSIIQGM